MTLFARGWSRYARQNLLVQIVQRHTFSHLNETEGLTLLLFLKINRKLVTKGVQGRGECGRVIALHLILYLFICIK